MPSTWRLGEDAIEQALADAGEERLAVDGHQTRPPPDAERRGLARVEPPLPVAFVPLLMDAALEDGDRDAGEELVDAVVGHHRAVALDAVEDGFDVLLGVDGDLIRVLVVPEHGPPDAIAVAVDALAFAHGGSSAPCLHPLLRLCSSVTTCRFHGTCRPHEITSPASFLPVSGWTWSTTCLTPVSSVRRLASR